MCVTKSEQLTVDYKRATELVAMLDKSFKEKQGVLSEQDDLVENQMPQGVKKLSKEHACFLFYTVLNDHGTKSSSMYSKAKNLYVNCPNYFCPEWIVNNFDEEKIPEILNKISKPLGARYPHALAKSWYYNSVKIVNEYQGNPLLLFNACNDAEELLERIKSFKGYGPKIGGMLLRTIIGLGFNNDLYNVDKVLVPVDIHDSRILFLTNVVKLNCTNGVSVNYYNYVKEAQITILSACNNNNIDWLDVDRALWLIGSRGCVFHRCSVCPINNMCSTMASN